MIITLKEKVAILPPLLQILEVLASDWETVGIIIMVYILLLTDVTSLNNSITYSLVIRLTKSVIPTSKCTLLLPAVHLVFFRFIKICIHCIINKGLVLFCFSAIGNLHSAQSYYNLYIPATLDPQVYKFKERQVDSSLSENQALMGWTALIIILIKYTMTSRKVA